MNALLVISTFNWEASWPVLRAIFCSVLPLVAGLIPGDPTRDLTAIKSISMVVKDGALYFPSEIYPNRRSMRGRDLDR